MLCGRLKFKKCHDLNETPFEARIFLEFNGLKIWYSGVFGVADYKSELITHKYKMTEPIYTRTSENAYCEIACPFSLKLHKWLSEIARNEIFRYIDVLIDINSITGGACAEVAPCTYAI